MGAMRTWRGWGIGLLGAVINGAASAVTVVIVDPQDFSPMQGGMTKLATVVAVSALFGAALYLKSHPLPESVTEEE